MSHEWTKEEISALLMGGAALFGTYGFFNFVKQSFNDDKGKSEYARVPVTPWELAIYNVAFPPYGWYKSYQVGKEMIPKALDKLGV